mgnify:CR=1 FL=1
MTVDLFPDRPMTRDEFRSVHGSVSGKRFFISVAKVATYEVRAECEEDARDRVWDWNLLHEVTIDSTVTEDKHE